MSPLRAMADASPEGPGEDPGGPAAGSAPWAQEPAALLGGLDVDSALGLSAAEVEERRRRFGPNAIELDPPRPWLGVLADQFKSVLVALLVGAAALSAAFGQWAEALAVVVVLLLNALIGFVTELRAVRSVEALRKLGASHASVRREGRLLTVTADELVPGDVLLVEGGDVVAADARVIKASRLEADESSLTGESVPVAKEEAAVPADAVLHERSSMLHKGTAVTRGSGEAVVVATGMATELGRIGKLVGEAGAGADGRTPLEKRLSGLARRLVWLTLVVAAAITLTGIGSGKSWLVLLQTAVALAVATVPEGLPIIATLTLAQGVRRLAKRNALVNRLSAVETLGATSVIITDKTGTLTENRMSVATFWLPAGEARPGEEGEGEVAEQLRHALTASALCVTAELPPPGAEEGEAHGVGDPLELALLRAARDAGLERAELLSLYPEMRQEAFDSETRLMATTHRLGEGAWVVVKGAPGAVVAAATTLADGRRTPLSAEAREAWLQRNRELAARGLRVLALAERVTPIGGRSSGADPAAPAGVPERSPYHELSLIGLVGLADPPRLAVRDALQRCREAGVRVVMATGDQAATARAIATQVGLDVDGPVVDGQAMARLLAGGPAEREELLAAAVLARVAPEQKLELIALHQGAGNVVAMTGDGVNDAPALRRADIGVAMGLRGTEVAREAADMVLLDDAFGTIVRAIREGRVIFENIRAFVLYLLSCNLSEIMVIGLAGVAGYPLPLLPLQILFLNLITDVFPALALGAGRGDARSLQRPPRPAAEPLLARRHWGAVTAYGALLTATTLGAFVVALDVLGASAEEAVTVAFLGLAIGQIWHVFNMRDPGSPLVRNQVTRNPWVWAATLGCTAVLVLVVVVAPLRRILHIALLDASGWWLVIVAGLAPMLLGQLGKALGLGRVS